MNGVTNKNDNNEQSPILDTRPIITCAGELEVFSVAIEDKLSQALPQDSCEWRRSLGRPVRAVHIGATFTPFSAIALPKANQWDLIRQPLFHIYWTECNDVDVYKASVRDEIDDWMKELVSKECFDFLIVVVENYDGKRTNKLLPRTTVLDKIRTDFASKQGDRCVSVINPTTTITTSSSGGGTSSTNKTSNDHQIRTTDSWRSLVERVRHLLLVAYSRAVSLLEDHVRQQRERRNEIGWNFTEYFQLQEELAQVLEMLGLYDEALVQYDELDALFSQFVVNGITGSSTDSTGWLSAFQRPLEQWHGLKINNYDDTSSLSLSSNTLTTLSRNPSILQLRAYLFAKQANMLLLTKKVWEMASRCLPFLHTCTRELTVLEISAPAGAIPCWLFLAAMEVLQICDKYNNADSVEDYSRYTACLWSYASEKIRYLGELCGLMPGGVPTSEQLHLVVSLSAGMGDNPGVSPGQPSATDKLKIALCSQDVFNKTYLELAELAMCTYKHIGRLRCARLIGRDCASFYMLLGEHQKAAAFLSDCVRTFEQDKWCELAAQTQCELAECYRKSNDYVRFIRTSCVVAATFEIDTLIRWTLFDEMKKCLDMLSVDQEAIVIVPFNDLIIKIVSVNTSNYYHHYDDDNNDIMMIIQDSYYNVDLMIELMFPREILCTSAMISIETFDDNDNPTISGDNNDNYNDDDDNKRRDFKNFTMCKDKMTRRRSRTQRSQESSSSSSSLLLTRKLRILRHLDYKQDKQLASASVVCKYPIFNNNQNNNKRKDSGSSSGLSSSSSSVVHHHHNVQAISDFRYCLEVDDLPLVLAPGINTIKFRKKITERGKYYLGQIRIHMGKLELISSYLTPRIAFEVKAEGPTVRLNKINDSPLLSGIEQLMNLIITIGSYNISPKSLIKLTASRGLTIQTTKKRHHVTNRKLLVNVLEIEVGERDCFTSKRIYLRVLADMLTRDHQITISCPWSVRPIVVKLDFIAPLSTTWRLHTLAQRKFVQINVTGQCEIINNDCNYLLLVERPLLNITVGKSGVTSIQVVDRSCTSSASQLISHGSTVSYMWEIFISEQQNTAESIKAEFTCVFKLNNTNETTIINDEDSDETNKLYKYLFDINNYQTLYILEANVEPTKGNEFCRVGALCHLNLSIRKNTNKLLKKCDDDEQPKQQQSTASVMYEVLAEQSVWAVCGRTAGVVSFEFDDDDDDDNNDDDSSNGGQRQTVALDVMPLTSGYLPLPLVRISKYIPASEFGTTTTISDKSVGNNKGGDTHPRLEPFIPGQVYNRSKGKQVHVIAVVNDSQITTITT